MQACRSATNPPPLAATHTLRRDPRTINCIGLQLPVRIAISRCILLVQSVETGHCSSTRTRIWWSAVLPFAPRDDQPVVVRSVSTNTLRAAVAGVAAA